MFLNSGVSHLTNGPSNSQADGVYNNRRVTARSSHALKKGIKSIFAVFYSAAAFQKTTFCFSCVCKGKGKGKQFPLQAWSGPEGSRKLRFPDFLTTAQDGGNVVSLTHRPPLPPGNAPIFLLEADTTPGP